ncbi:MAG TPA: class I SAM-dependent methyltransferase [Saprospiraceae bacterium]|nr:class I SAM-dependent methyltransferase [Saprospiraceae bacterium]
MKDLQTAERVSHTDVSDNYVYQRSLLAYLKAAELVSGNVLEIGTGSGYGVEVLAPKANHLTTIDKFSNSIDFSVYDNVTFRQMNVPPFQGIDDNQFDFVVSFQVIEHIEDDHAFVSEIHRVLKPGGKFIVTTPNIKMSLTRNPWHVREYTIGELDALLREKFGSVEKLGVFGNEKIMEYYENNRKSVAKITRWDIFNLQYRLPRRILQIPYDILNRRNRKKLVAQDNSLVASITKEDYAIEPAAEGCFDLFYVAAK